LGRKALRGLRLIHTHLYEEPLNKDDLTDLALLRLDLIAALGVKKGLPGNISLAYLMPHGSEKSYEIMQDESFYHFRLDFLTFVTSLEEEMERSRVFSPHDKREKAILVSVSFRPRYEQEDSMEELTDLARSSDVLVLDAIMQRPKEVNPKYVMGEGKLKELIIHAMNRGATLLIFDQNLNPSQTRAIADYTELKVIDRTAYPGYFCTPCPQQRR